MRTRVVLGAVLVVATTACVGGWALFHAAADRTLPLTFGRACQVRADGTVELDATQMANASTIAAVGMRRHLPDRAITVALATAFQESKLENLNGGDRDSVGLFQQRPSQGWGTAEQISDPRYATGKFYDSLVKVRGWEGMRVTEAAQAVQHSAHPELYERWAVDALVLTTALTGQTGGAVACRVGGDPQRRGEEARTALAAAFKLDWGPVTTGAPEKITGVTVDAGDPKAGWRYAYWLVSQAQQQGVRRVRYADLEWTSAGGTWAKATGPAAQQVTAEVFAAQ